MIRVLIGSPIRQDPLVLAEFLKSLERIVHTSFEPHFAFVDDNTDAVSSAILRTFVIEHGGAVLLPSVIGDAHYSRNDFTHHWTDAAIWKVASFKDQLLALARNDEYEYAFLVDSDLILHPFTIEQLLRAKKNVISEIFWTAWQPGCRPDPQVWVSDEYTLYRRSAREPLSDEEIGRRTQEFLDGLRVPGVHEVGGLGACTLISKTALDVGVCFKQIPNLSFWGEDRHFCVRAAALGLGLFVDTHLPAYHVYRDTELAGVERFAELHDDMVSRFVRAGDACVSKVMWPLPTPWWSRGHEYAWAEHFVSKDHVVLDAACGVEHPLKFWLAENAKECHACDLDRRLMDDQAISGDVRTGFGGEAVFPSNLYRRLADITQLPYPEVTFDRVFCVSVLEHMPVDAVTQALSEFHRVIKPNGLVILTFDVPPIDPQTIAALIAESGFEFAGPFDPELPDDALFTTMYGGLRCFRALLRKE